MSTTTSIEWTDATWNPIRGCSRVSEGCRNCYAEKVAYRFGGQGQPYEGLATKVNGHAAWTGKVEFAEKHLLDPLRWGPVLQNDGTAYPGSEQAKLPPFRRRRIFVNSMSDLFHENVPDEWIDRIFAVMALCPQHTFQILTKRPERMLEYFSGLLCGRISFHVARLISNRRLKLGMPDGFRWSVDGTRVLVSGGVAEDWPLPNVWLGVSVENQKTADERIPLLLETPAAVRFISAEPLLGPLDVTAFLGINHEDEFGERGFKIENPDQTVAREMNRLGGLPMHDPWVKGLDLVICGGESGPGARPMHPNWARSLRDQCQAASVAFFFKQWGEHLPAMTDGPVIDGKCAINCSDDPQPVGKKAAGALLDGREWREFPEVRA